MSNRYDVQHLSSSFDMFLDGTIVSKTIVHPQQRGTEFELYGFGSTIWEDPIDVVSQSSSVTAHVTAIYTSLGRQQGQTGHHDDDYDYNIRIMLKPGEGSRENPSSNSGMISLKLVYSTPAAFWIPRYTLDIRKNHDAVLTLQAGLCLPQPGAWGDSVVSVSNRSIQHHKTPHVSSFGDVSRKEHAPGQSLSKFASYTWPLQPSFASDRTIGSVYITECLVDIQPESRALSSRLRARLNTINAWSLPEGDMQIKLRGNVIKSVPMPLWNPGQVLSVEVDQDSATAPVRLPHRPSFDPCRIECLLNPSVLERNSSNYRVGINVKAEDECRALVSTNNHQALSSKPPPRPLPPADLNSTGNRRPICPTEMGPDNPTASDATGGRLELLANGNLVQRSRPNDESFGEQFRCDRLFQRNDDSSWHRAAEETKAAVSFMELGSDASQTPKEGRGHDNVPLNGEQAPQPRSLKPSPVPVNLRISKAWKDSAACRWLPSRGHWETFAGGAVYLIEVRLAGDQEPIHLKVWRRGEWKGRLCNGSSLSMTYAEVVRLTNMGGWGQGTLLY